jgi:diguanylate cyclase (GGDEF) domain
MDSLSGLNNRRRFRELGEEAFQRAVRYGEKLTVLMMDLDHFKRINDTYGHSAGDQVIKEFSDMMAHEFRGTDITGRMGGEEFAVVMLYTDGETALQKAEGLRAEVETYGFRHENHSMKLTVSIGIAELNADILDFDMLISQADRALYQAKEREGIGL